MSIFFGCGISSKPSRIRSHWATARRRRCCWRGRWCLECPRGQTGRESITSDGPTRLPEAPRAIQSGKLPRKVGLIVVRHDQQYEMTLQAETLAVSGCRLPAPEAADERARLEERRHAIAPFAGDIRPYVRRIQPASARATPGPRNWGGCRNGCNAKNRAAPRPPVREVHLSRRCGEREVSRGDL